MILHPYQSTARDDIESLWLAGVMRILGVAATGAGKSVLAADLIQRAVARGWRVLFLAHRIELINQTSAKLDRFGVRHGVIMAGHKRVAPSLPVQVASVPTLVRRIPMLARMHRRPEFDLIIVDEAHRSRSDSYHRIYDTWDTARILGLTATPIRSDGRGLGELFQESIVIATPAELISTGFLVPYRARIYDSDELDALDSVSMKDGDFDPKAIARLMGKPAIVGRVAEEWAKSCIDESGRGRPSIYFAASVDRSQELAREFNELRHHGGPICHAEHLDGTSDADLRAAILGVTDQRKGRFERGEVTIVTNVGILTEGTDLPFCEVIGLVNPTLSWGRFLQQVGRGMRTSPDTGKTHCIIMDHARCVRMHGLPDDDRDYSLTQDKRIRRVASRELPPPNECAKCWCAFPRTMKACPDCGAANESWAGREVRELDTASVAEIGTVSEADQRTMLATWLREGRNEGKPGAAVARFVKQFGRFPPAEWMR